MPNQGGRPHGMPRPMGKTSHRPRSAGPPALGTLDIVEAEERLARVIGRSGRPYSATPGEERIRRGPASCAVCRTEPMIFRECPECRARYCSSGCLQSWYDYQKPSRAPAMEVSIVESYDSDNLVVELKDSLDKDGTKINGEQWETGVTRIAGGFAIVERDGKTADSKTRRWGITSVDGWVLGTPGPGPDWRPSKGVRLKLEALGSCQVCENQFAVPEYICNSASRPSSASRRSPQSVQKPRVKMVDASTQTEVRSGLCRAQAAVAGDALAALALPVEGTSELVLTAEPDFARTQVRSALAAVASVVGVARTNESPGQSVHILEQLKQLKASLPSSPSHLEQDQNGQYEGSSSRPRVLGHRHRAAVPTFKDGIPSFQAGAASALASGAVDAVHKFLDEGNTKAASSGSTSWKHLTNTRQVGESDEILQEIESVLLRGRGGELQGSAPIYDAIANMGGLLWASMEAPKEVGKTPSKTILSVLGVVSHLLQSSGWASSIALDSKGRHLKPMKFRDYWRTPADPGKSEAAASGWNLLQEALAALNCLIKESSSLFWSSDASETTHFPTWCQKSDPVEAFRCSKCKTYFHTECHTCGTPRPRKEDWEEFLSNAVRSIARIALFLDAKDIAEEDARKARIEEEEARARAQAEAQAEAQRLQAEAQAEAQRSQAEELARQAQFRAGSQQLGFQMGAPPVPLPPNSGQQMAPQAPPQPPGSQPLGQQMDLTLPPGPLPPPPPLGGQLLGQQMVAQPPLAPGLQPLGQQMGVTTHPGVPPPVGGTQPPVPPGSQALGQQMAPPPGPLQPPLPPGSQPLGQPMAPQAPPQPPGSQPLGQQMGLTSTPGPLPPPPHLGGQLLGQQMVAQPLPLGSQPLGQQMAPQPPLPPGVQLQGQQMDVQQSLLPIPPGSQQQLIAQPPPMPPSSQPLGQQMFPPQPPPLGSQPFGQQMGVQQPLLAPGGQLLGQQDATVSNQFAEAQFNQNPVDMYLHKNVSSAPSAVQESAPAPGNLQQAMGDLFGKKRGKK